MTKAFLVLLGLTAWWQLSMIGAAAQPSVYSGVYAYGEGDLTSSSDWQAVTNFVGDAQKNVSIINNFDSWTDSSSSTNGTQTFPTTEMDNIRSFGSIPMFTWQPQNGSQGVTQSFTLASISAGHYDSYITTWAAAAKAWGHPFFLRLAHEMNGNWYPWCAGVNGNTAAQYMQMWQHVHDIFTSVGATNVTGVSMWFRAWRHRLTSFIRATTTWTGSRWTATTGWPTPGRIFRPLRPPRSLN
jgi:hypothetical protein